MKKLIVTATTTGAVTVEAEGFQGKGCQAASEFLTKALGTVTERKLKPEAHALVTTTHAYQNLNA
jgi:hypothetical protein